MFLILMVYPSLTNLLETNIQHAKVSQKILESKAFVIDSGDSLNNYAYTPSYYQHLSYLVQRVLMRRSAKEILNDHAISLNREFA